MPTVTEIASALVNRLGTQEYWLDLGQSLIRILTGFGLAAVVGVLTGILLARDASPATTATRVYVVGLGDAAGAPDAAEL